MTQPTLLSNPPPETCRGCGACCRGRDGTILVYETDLLRWRRAGRDDLLARVTPGHFSELAFEMTEGACVHQGTRTSATDCSIYEQRGRTCRDFEMGSQQCLEARRRHGLG